MKMLTKRRLVGTAFIAPWLIGLLAFFLVPVLQTLWFSFHTITPDANGYTAVWEGLKNYRFALTSSRRRCSRRCGGCWGTCRSC